MWWLGGWLMIGWAVSCRAIGLFEDMSDGRLVDVLAGHLVDVMAGRMVDV